jgi:hypothetical protein
MMQTFRTDFDMSLNWEKICKVCHGIKKLPKFKNVNLNILKIPVILSLTPLSLPWIQIYNSNYC